jgi:type I restriction enzyme S subunit
MRDGLPKVEVSYVRRFKPYRAYKPSGIEWLGRLPAHWRTLRIKHTTYVKGRIGWQGLRFDEFTDEGPFLVTGTDFEDGKINWKTCYHVSDERYREDPYIQLREGDLLITKDGTIGKVAVVRDLPGLASLNSGVFLTRPTCPVYETMFMYWVLTSAAFTGFIDTQKSGTTIVHLYQNVFVDFAFPVPTIEEQHAIADFLDWETAKIDRLIEKKRALIVRLKEKRSSLISRTVTRGLPPDAARVAGFDPHPIMKPSGADWLGDIPKHWNAVQAKHVSSIFVPQRDKPELNTEGEGYPWITIDDLKGEIVSKSNKDLFVSLESARLTGSRTVRAGSVLASCVGAFGISSIAHGELVINQQLQAYLPKHVHAPFLNFVIGISVPYFDQMATMATINYVNANRFGSLPIPFPPLAEQVAIANYLRAEIATLDFLVAKVEAAIERLQEYGAALITAAVTGKIDLRGTAP